MAWWMLSFMLYSLQLARRIQTIRWAWLLKPNACFHSFWQSCCTGICLLFAIVRRGLCLLQKIQWLPFSHLCQDIHGTTDWGISMMLLCYFVCVWWGEQRQVVVIRWGEEPFIIVSDIIAAVLYYLIDICKLHLQIRTARYQPKSQFPF